MYSNLTLTRDGFLSEITFCRPDTRNAFDAALHAELADALADVRRDTETRALLLSAQGNVFIGGGQFEYLRQLRDDPALRRRSYREGYDIFTLLHDMQIPIVVAMQGDALGFGATIVTACDIIVAWEGAKLADPHVRAGLVAGDGGALSWSAAAGMTRAKRYLLTGDALSAKDAYTFGMITDLVATPEEAYPRARALAEKVAALPPLAIQGTKRAFNALSKQRNAGALEVSMLNEIASIDSEDLEEALKSAAEKRPGHYKNC
jgi:enoyl-CoA hydratase